MTGEASGMTDFARSVRERHQSTRARIGVMAFAWMHRREARSAQPTPLRERWMVVSERWGTPVWAPRIDVRIRAHVQPTPSRRDVPDSPYAALPPAGRYLRREAADPEALFQAHAGPGAAKSLAAEPPRLLPPVERVIRRDPPVHKARDERQRPVEAGRLFDPPRRPDPAFTEADVSLLTDRVMRSIDQRLRAYRERLGRA